MLTKKYADYVAFDEEPGQDILAVVSGELLAQVWNQAGRPAKFSASESLKEFDAPDENGHPFRMWAYTWTLTVPAEI